MYVSCGLLFDCLIASYFLTVLRSEKNQSKTIKWFLLKKLTSIPEEKDPNSKIWFDLRVLKTLAWKVQDRKIIHGRLILIEQNRYFACSDVCPNHADEDQFFYVKRHAALHFLQTEGGQEYKRKKKRNQKSQERPIICEERCLFCCEGMKSRVKDSFSHAWLVANSLLCDSSSIFAQNPWKERHYCKQSTC